LTLEVADGEEWKLLYDAGGTRRYLSPTVIVEMHRAETEAYVYNLQSPEPSLFAVVRHDEESERDVPFDIHVATVSPYEAQDYLDCAEEQVDRIGLPAEMVDWMQDFVAEHHVEQEFKKRKRNTVSVEEHKFGQETLMELRRRMGSDGSGSVH
jgi:hypothetical protein